MDIVYLPELIQDAITAALYQKPSATNNELLNAVNYYLQNDSFMQL